MAKLYMLDVWYFLELVYYLKFDTIYLAVWKLVFYACLSF